MTDPHILTQDDIFQASYVLDGVLAPDGAAVVYTLSTTTGKGKDERQATALWQVATGGGEPRRLTGDQGDDSSPQFSPDGGTLYFLSTRSGRMQVHRIAVDGGEAEQVTDLPQGVTKFELSPDGQTLVFSAPPTPPEPANPHTRVDRTWWRFDGMGYFDQLDQAVYSMPAKGGEPKALTAHDGLVMALHWSPDGSEIGFVCWGRKGRAFMRGDLLVVDQTGEERTLAADWMLTDFFWAPDGERLGFHAVPEGRIAEQTQLWTLSAQGGQAQSRTGGADLAVGALFQINSPAARAPSRPIVGSAGEAAFVTVAVGGQMQVFKVALAGDERCEPLVAGERMNGLLDGNDDKLLLTVQDHNRPPELVLFDLASGEEAQLTDHNATWRQSVRWPDIEGCIVASAPGVTVEGWVLKPPHLSPPYKTILYIHGGPHVGFGLSFQADFQELVGAGYAVAYCNPRGSTGYGSGFSSAIVECWGQPEQEDFEAFLDELVRRGIAHPDLLGVTGVSGGGHLSGWLIGHTHRFKAAVPEQGVYNMFSMWGVSDAGSVLISLEMGGKPYEQPERYWALSPVAHAHKCRTPTLLIQGENDLRCPMEQAEQMYQTIHEAGCPVELLRLHGCTHGLELAGPPALRRFRMDAMKAWFGRYITTDVPDAVDAPGT